MVDGLPSCTRELIFVASCLLSWTAYLFAFLNRFVSLLKRIYSRRNEFAPKGSKLEFASKGSKFFSFRVDPFSEKRQNDFDDLPLLKVDEFSLKISIVSNYLDV